MHRKVFGSFAVMYHSALFSAIIEWLDETSNTRAFDHIFPDLVAQGYLVRAAFPFLVIPEVRHASKVDPSREHGADLAYRAKLHRYGELGEYCDPLAGTVVAV